jgi:hypothetical protein
VHRVGNEALIYSTVGYALDDTGVNQSLVEMDNPDVDCTCESKVSVHLVARPT